MSEKTENKNKSAMLIDGGQAGETRVAVIENGRLQEVDHEVVGRRTLKGNIYLAKIIRVEPSLQAAFVDFGGETHGFLPFSEIHPNYFRIPVADREKLEEELRSYYNKNEEDVEEDLDAILTDDTYEDSSSEELNACAEEKETIISEEDTQAQEGSKAETSQENKSTSTSKEKAFAPSMIRGRYQIQEVIENRQVILVQVVKEARGNKGAALTTYLSLAGRYCVFMPNNIRGNGGVSRKITDSEDRKRLRAIHEGLKIPQGMGVILRTAGTKRTKAEIKRDYEALLRHWEEIRALTLKSVAPSLVHEEANLIKRAIRDLYSKELDEVLVEGKEAYKQAKAFMKSLMPSHARKVKEYKAEKNAPPLFSHYHVEEQMDAIFDSEVKLPSGGSLVIDTTEALVAIDVNSGRATKERSIRQTALKTNLEAAKEVARQLKLRDLGGLVVVDFIDMAESRHNSEVERVLRAAMSQDRARVQIGRISNFGLLELSRQRLKPSLIESHYRKCDHCQGSGLIRSNASCARMILRSLAEMDMTEKGEVVKLLCSPEVAVFILNERRHLITQLEESNAIHLIVQPSKDIHGSEFHLEFKVKGRMVTESFGTAQKEQEPVKKSKSRRSKSKRKDKEKSQIIGAEKADQATNLENVKEKEKKAGRRRARRSSKLSDEEALLQKQEQQENSQKKRGRRRRRSSSKTIPESSSHIEASSENIDNMPVSAEVSKINPKAENEKDEKQDKTSQPDSVFQKSDSSKTELVIENVGVAKEPKKGWWKRLIK